MLFCIGDGKYESSGRGYQKNYQIFNQQVTKDEWEKVKSELPEIELKVAKWIDKKDMSDDDKENSSVWKETGGILKVFSYEEAWANWWKEAKQEDKNKILNCKYFDAKMFTEITGLKDFATPSLKGKIVEVKIDGQEYKAIIQ